MRVQLGGTVVNNDQAAIYRRWGYNDVCCPQDVRAALDSPEDQEGLIFEINSGGGSVYAGLEMYTLLRNSSRHVTVEIQSIAASAASVFASGADTVRISPVANVMLHRARSWAEGTEQDMGEAGQMLRTVDESILNAYEHKCQGKTDRETLHDLMRNETFFTAQEAVERGFADKILWEDQDAETKLTSSAVAMAGGMRQAFAALPPIEELMRREQEGTQGAGEPKNAGGVEDNTGKPENETEERKMPMTLDELTRDNPELLAEIRTAAAEAERERLSAIDDMSMAGFEDLISAAKEDPEATAESVAVQIVARQKKQGKKFLGDRDKDVKDGKVDQVETSTPAAGENGQDELNAVLDEVFPKN